MNFKLSLTSLRRLAGAKSARLAGVAVATLMIGVDAKASASGDLWEIGVTFDPLTRETQIKERVSANLCVFFRLDEEWTLSRDTDATLLQAAGGDADLEIRLRSASELQEFPQTDLAGREAAALQRTYEGMIGKPAQAISHQPTGLSGVSRWSATWVDANLAGGNHALEVETFIVDLKSAALELTLTEPRTNTAYANQIRRILSSLRIGKGTECGSPARSR
jgi:hypothetical protein